MDGILLKKGKTPNITSDDDSIRSESVVNIVGKSGGSRSRSGSGRSTPSVRSLRVKRAANDDTQSVLSYSSASDSSISSISSIKSQEKSRVPAVAKLSPDDILTMKKEILYQFERLEKKGIKLPRKFTIASSLDDMKAEYERMKKDREVDISIRFQRKMLMAIITGIEFLNGKFDPFDVSLDGWSESINDNINDYDDVFEELHDKYKGKANMPPELKLMFALGGSAFMFHLRNTMFKSALPHMMAGMSGGQQGQQTQQGTQSQQGGLSGLMGGLMSGGIGNILGGLMGGGQQSQMPNPFSGKGPTKVDDILNEMNINDDDRIETLSTMSGSEYTDVPDDQSRIFKTKKNTKRTLDI